MIWCDYGYDSVYDYDYDHDHDYDYDSDYYYYLIASRIPPGLIQREIYLKILVSNAQQSNVRATALNFLFFDVETLVFLTLTCNE